MFCFSSGAHVIILNTETDALKLREAKAFGRIKFEKAIRTENLVADPRKDNGQELYKIIYYGTKDDGKKLISSCKDDDFFLQDEPVSIPSTSKSATRSSARYQQDCDSFSHDIYRLLAVIRDEQKEVKKQIDRFEDENRSLKNKLDEIIEKNSKEKRSSKVTYSEFAELVQHCTSEVAKKRLERDFEEKLAKIPWETLDVNKKAKKNIIDELRWERRISKMISNIGTILFGSDLLTHLLGRNGKRERSRRESERPHVFSSKQESRLRRVLGVFGDVFLSDKAWKAIVQYHINQKGRDVKKAKKRSIEDSDSDTSKSSGDNSLKKRRDNDSVTSESESENKDTHREINMESKKDEEKTQEKENVKETENNNQDNDENSNKIQQGLTPLSQNIPLTQIIE